MKTLLSLLSLCFVFYSSNAQLTQVFVEEIAHNSPNIPELDGYTSYRVFAQTNSPLDFVTEVTGEASECPASVCSTGDWFNDFDFGGNLGQTTSLALWDIFETTRFDTYYTIGYSSASTLGIPEAEDLNLTDANGYLGHEDTNATTTCGSVGAWQSIFAAAPSGECIIDISDAIGGAWFALNGDPNGYGTGVNNSVLLGQFTTNGTFSHDLNISVIPFEQPLETYRNCTSSIPGLSYISGDGCMDDTACNFNPDAIIDNGSCAYAGDSCSDGNSSTTNDMYSETCNCVGDLNGCMDVEAENYNSAAIVDNGTCQYWVTFSVNMQNVEEDFEQPYLVGEFNGWCGNCNPLTLENGFVFSTQLLLPEGSYQYKFSADDWNIQENLPDDMEDFPCVVVVEGLFVNRILELTENTELPTVCWEFCENCGGCTDSAACNFDPNAIEDNGNCNFVGDSCSDFDFNTTNDVYDENCDCVGSISGCTDDSAINYDSLASLDDGSCVVPNCSDAPLSMNYCYGDSESTFFFFTESNPGDGVILNFLSGTLEVGWDFVNIYDENLEIINSVDGDLTGLIVNSDSPSIAIEVTSDSVISCQDSDLPEIIIEYYCSEITIAGCTDDSACNYDPQATLDSGSCILIGDSCDDGNDDSSNDVINDNCECFGEVEGCTDPNACNYIENAVNDDNSCVYSEDLLNDELSGAISLPIVSNPDLCVPVPGNNICATDSPESTANTNDVWYLLEPNSSSCHHIVVSSVGDTFIDLTIGIYDEDANLISSVDANFSGFEEITTPMSSDQAYYLNVAGWITDVTGNFEICVQELSLEEAQAVGCGDGCTDADACNYDATAELDNGSCFSPGDSCDDGNPQTPTDIFNNECECIGIVDGCTDPFAVNFNEFADEDNGSCCYSHSIEVELLDTFGDGGPAFQLFDSQNDIVNEGELLDGFGPAMFTSCFEESGCYLFWLFADAFPGEIIANVYVDGNLAFSHSEMDDFTQYPILINIGDNPDCIIYGCTDNAACNYFGLATEDDGTCDFDSCVGCSTFGATNYDENVTIDDGSCVWDVSGVVFVDDNYNGVMDPFEAPLPYQQVSLEPGGLVVITDDAGAFSFGNLDVGTYVTTVNYTANWTNYTTDISQTSVYPQNGGQTIYFGVTNEAVPSPSACVDFYQWGFGVPCNDVLNFNICYRNMSPYPISGVVQVVLDPLVSYNSSYPSNATVNGNVVTWEFADLGSWVMNFDDIIINTPDETHIGEFMTNSVTIFAMWEGSLIPLTEQIITQEVTCAYDPNDITGIPEGYTDEHFVLEDTRMEYLIRFQNTGNAPAGTVTIVDTLDLDMDWDSFELIANSHSVMTTIEQETGKVEFLFDNINLPDSTENEPESHGMVSFKIDFAEGITLGEEVNQTAYIFFDNNPPVVTNTTWHTIHECGGEGVFNASATEVCIGEDISFSSVYPHVEDYQWNVNSTPVGNDADYSQLFNESGDYIVQLVSDNPICSDATSQIITIHDLPTAEITEEGAILTASPASGYQWYQDGEQIEGATSQTYEATADGSFYVVVVNENNCSSQSETVMIVNVSELTETLILLYPNPMTSVSTLEISTPQKKTIEVVDTQGKVVRAWENITDQRVEFQKGELSSGTYFVNISLEDGTVKTMALIIR